MSKTIKLKYKMCGKRRGENDIDEYYIQDDATDKTVAIVYGHGSMGNETHVKEIVRRWNTQPDLLTALENFPVKLDSQTYEQFYNCCMSWIRTDRKMAIAQAIQN